VACAPNGARRTKADHPALPMTAPELASAARDICDAGAALLHLHVRDACGGHSLDADLYREALKAIRGEVGDDLVIQITTESAGVYETHEQLAVVQALWPEAASCALRELCPDDAAINRYADFLSECQARRTWVQHILYDGADTERFLQLWRDGVIPDREPFVLLVIGRYGERSGQSASDLVARIAPFLNDDAPLWAACAFGAHEAQTVIAAAAAGGHVRVGFENNLEQPDGTQASSNAAQVARVVESLSAIGRAPVTATKLRAALRSEEDH
jgi:uncharacterized protein (DUF849 family)